MTKLVNLPVQTRLPRRAPLFLASRTPGSMPLLMGERPGLARDSLTSPGSVSMHLAILRRPLIAGGMLIMAHSLSLPLQQPNNRPQGSKPTSLLPNLLMAAATTHQWLG